MTHALTQLRNAVATKLTGLPTTGANVFPGRVYPVEKGTLPSLSIYTRGDVVDADAQQMDGPGREYLRGVGLVVEAHAAWNLSVDDVLDRIALEVEPKMAEGVVIDDIRVDLVYAGMEIEVAGEGEEAHGVRRMNFNVDLATLASNPAKVLRT